MVVPMSDAQRSTPHKWQQSTLVQPDLVFVQLQIHIDVQQWTIGASVYSRDFDDGRTLSSQGIISRPIEEAHLVVKEYTDALRELVELYTQPF